MKKNKTEGDFGWKWIGQESRVQCRQDQVSHLSVYVNYITGYVSLEF